MPTLLDNPGVSRIHNLSPGLPYRLTNLPNKSDDEPLHHCKLTSCLQMYPNQNNFGFLNLSHSFCKVNVNSGSSKSIWGYGGRFDGEEGSLLFYWGEGVG